MRTITITIDDRDYADMIRHFAKDRIGRPLVAVHTLVAIDDDEDFDIQEELANVAWIERRPIRVRP